MELEAAAPAALAVSIGIQQMVEFVDTTVLDLLGLPENSPRRKRILKLLSVALGLTAAWVCPACVDLAKPLVENPVLRHLLTAFALASGTEGVNSLLKYARYAKEEKKGAAAERLHAVPQLELHAVTRPDLAG